jgi:hypothetical protein
MALNWSGIPIGAALGGYLADSSVGAAVAVSVVAACAGTLVAVVLVPRRDETAVSGGPTLQPPGR